MKPDDEYGIKPILSHFNADDEEIVKALSEHLDKKLTVYLEDHDGIRKSAFTEMSCYLHKALLDAKDYGQLKDRIMEIIKAI